MTYDVVRLFGRGDAVIPAKWIASRRQEAGLREAQAQALQIVAI